MPSTSAWTSPPARTPISSHIEDAQNIKEGKYEAFQWACAVGLVGQDGETKLRPNDKVTREDMITMLCAFDAVCGRDVTPGGMAYREFTDWSTVSKSASRSDDVGHRRRHSYRYVRKCAVSETRG
jgi:hypothetical protein